MAALWGRRITSAHCYSAVNIISGEFMWERTEEKNKGNKAALWEHFQCISRAIYCILMATYFCTIKHNSPWRWIIDASLLRNAFTHVTFHQHSWCSRSKELCEIISADVKCFPFRQKRIEKHSCKKGIFNFVGNILRMQCELHCLLLIVNIFPTFNIAR